MAVMLENGKLLRESEMAPRAVLKKELEKLLEDEFTLESQRVFGSFDASEVPLDADGFGLRDMPFRECLTKVEMDFVRGRDRAGILLMGGEVLPWFAPAEDGDLPLDTEGWCGDDAGRIPVFTVEELEAVMPVAGSFELALRQPLFAELLAEFRLSGGAGGAS